MFFHYLHNVYFHYRNLASIFLSFFKIPFVPEGLSVHFSTMNREEFLEIVETHRKEAGLSMAALSKRAFGSEKITAVQDLKRGSSPNLERVSALCDALGLELYIGPKRERESAVVFAEREVEKIDPSIDGSPEALRLGYLPIPFAIEDKAHRGAGPIAISRSWISDQGLDPATIACAAIPDDAMAPSIAPGDLLLLDGSTCPSQEAAVFAYTFEGKLGVGWVVAPEEGAYVAFFQRKYSTTLVLKGKPALQFRSLGRVIARLDGSPGPWLSAHEKIEMLKWASDALSRTGR